MTLLREDHSVTLVRKDPDFIPELLFGDIKAGDEILVRLPVSRLEWDGRFIESDWPEGMGCKCCRGMSFTLGEIVGHTPARYRPFNVGEKIRIPGTETPYEIVSFHGDVVWLKSHAYRSVGLSVLKPSECLEILRDGAK